MKGNEGLVQELHYGMAHLLNELVQRKDCGCSPQHNLQHKNLPVELIDLGRLAVGISVAVVSHVLSSYGRWRLSIHEPFVELLTAVGIAHRTITDRGNC